MAINLTKEEIETGDKSIVEFMGYEYVGRRLILHSASDGDNLKDPSYSGYVKKDQIKAALKPEFYKDHSVIYGMDYSEVIKTAVKRSHYLTAIRNRKTKLDCITGSLKYSTSIERLMEVVEKIEEMNFSSEMRYTPSIGHSFVFFSAGATVFKTYIYHKRIDAIYAAVVGFIKWYNSAQR